LFFLKTKIKKYFKNKFGVRSEIDFYVDKNYKLIITTISQKQIIKIWKKN